MPSPVKRDEPQKSYAVASLLAQYRFDDHWHLSVNLNNVFDKTCRTVPTAHVYGAQRNLQATLRYQF
ncbi:MAG: TonB-dependent receptor [Rhodocyclaceae bacterium]|nr:TonB-dependent receptor [Rhodocyclaceae bacterium]